MVTGLAVSPGKINPARPDVKSLGTKRENATRSGEDRVRGVGGRAGPPAAEEAPEADSRGRACWLRWPSEQTPGREVADG